jgi:hypothetical protein
MNDERSGTMDLAKLIHQIRTNPTTRRALESGEIALAGLRLSPAEMAAVAATLRDSRYLRGGEAESLFEKLFNTVCGWSGTGSDH